MEPDLPKPPTASFGEVRARLDGAERSIAEVKTDIAEIRQQMGKGFADLGDSIRNQIEGMRSRGTNWVGIGSVAVAAVGVLVVLASSILSPINSALTDTKDALKLIDQNFARRDDVKDAFWHVDQRMNKYDERLERLVTKDEDNEFKTRLDQRDVLEHETLLRDMGALGDRAGAIEGNLIKRPEINALLDNLGNRLDALSRNQEDMRRDLGSAYGIGDELKSLRTAQETLNNRFLSLLGLNQVPPPAALAK